MKRLVSLGLVALGLAAVLHSRPPGDVELLSVQTVDDVTYFHVRFTEPPDLIRDVRRDDRPWERGRPDSLAPRLVSPDGKARLIVARLGGPRGPDPRFTPKDAFIKEKGGKDGDKERDRPPVEVRGLEFVGRCDGKSASLTLQYPVSGRRLFGKLSRTPAPPAWRDKSVTLDFTKVEKGVDLDKLWAAAQRDEFRRRAAEVSSFGFYDFAARAVARKHGLGNEGLSDDPNEWRTARWRPQPNLYDLTTGAAAMAETLQVRRMTRRGIDKKETRDVAVKTLRGIDVAEHPWKKMMGEKKPAAEPLAEMVPHDNYYVTFRRLDRMAAFAQVLGAWGGNLLESYEMTSRDPRYWQRYERQLCLRLDELAKSADAVTAVALTGSDAYLREGSDLTVLFQLAQPKRFDAAVVALIGEAKKGHTLKEGTTEHEGVEINSYVSPLREVSLYRATIGEVRLFSNSPAGLRRVIDTAKGKHRRLSESLDFQYMRTIFRADDKAEDGFAFLSDPFIRNLVGPAMKIKQRRRFEALTSLHMLTHGAMLTGYLTGKAAKTEKEIFDRTTLAPAELHLPEGAPVRWDGEHQVAVSDAYGTVHFATPLIEVPIDQVTRTEAEEYERFRQEYLGLWRQFFDPMGFRVALADGEVKLDTYILPLIENSAYNWLRRVAGTGTVKLAPGRLSSKTLLQWMLHLSTDADTRGGWLGMGGPRGGAEAALFLGWALDPVGEWFQVRVDDSENYAELFDLFERQQRGDPVDTAEVMRLVWTLPIAVGVDLKNKVLAAAALASARTSTLAAAPGMVTWGPLEKEYKGVSIVRIQATESAARAMPLGGRAMFRPAVYYAMIDGGLYIALNEEMLRSLIDEAADRKDDKAKTVDVAASLHVSPGAAKATRDLVKRLLERDVIERARASEPVWHALYASGVVAADAPPEKAAEAAYRWLGFVPVSPDGTAFKWDAKAAEVVNERHGSRRQPKVATTLLELSPVNQLLEAVESVRADLRFREDGIHTVLTLRQRR